MVTQGGRFSVLTPHWSNQVAEVAEMTGYMNIVVHAGIRIGWTAGAAGIRSNSPSSPTEGSADTKGVLILQRLEGRAALGSPSELWLLIASSNQKGALDTQLSFNSASRPLENDALGIDCRKRLSFCPLSPEKHSKSVLAFFLWRDFQGMVHKLPRDKIRFLFLFFLLRTFENY